jgi:hypothetical protein
VNKRFQRDVTGKVFSEYILECQAVYAYFGNGRENAGKGNKLNGVQGAVGSNPIAPTKENKGLAG